MCHLYLDRRHRSVINNSFPTVCDGTLSLNMTGRLTDNRTCLEWSCNRGSEREVLVDTGISCHDRQHCFVGDGKL